MLKEIAAELSLAVYIRTGTVTSPKEMVAVPIDRAAMHT
jgi:hypothetical protein